MALTEKNIEDISPRVIALIQRLSEVQQIGQRLLTPTLWRSADGKLAVGALTEDEKKELRERIRKDLAEASVIIAAIETFLQ